MEVKCGFLPCTFSQVSWKLCKFHPSLSGGGGGCACERARLHLVMMVPFSSGPSVLPHFEFPAEDSVGTASLSSSSAAPHLFSSLLTAPRFSGWSMCQLDNGSVLFSARDFVLLALQSCLAILLYHLFCFSPSCWESCAPLVLVGVGR